MSFLEHGHLQQAISPNVHMAMLPSHLPFAIYQAHWEPWIFLLEAEKTAQYFHHHIFRRNETIRANYNDLS